MKASKYIVNVSRNGHSYWFNTLTRNYFRLSLPTGNKIRTIMKEGNWESVPESFRNKLIMGGFIIEDSTDEIQYIRERNLLARDNKSYFLILLPTLNCNYHCWYCIQDHVESKMDYRCMEKIKAHIDHMVDVEKIESLHLDWFGGEPLMYFDDIVEPISRYAIKKCDVAGIPFMNSSTTNGYYLNDKVIEKCVQLKFKHFQITLDGSRRFHDKVKFTDGCVSTFNHVLTNIYHLLRDSVDIRVYLRINYTHKNLDNGIVEEVNGFIPDYLRYRIIITPCKVWQEKVDKNFHSNLHSILDGFREAGYQVKYWNPANNFIPCYANKKYYNAISFDGNVVKCTACNDLYDSNPRGVLKEDGQITWNDNYDEKFNVSSYENDRCLNCNRLPLCMGLCPRDHFNGGTHCKEDVLDVSFEDSIVSQIDREYEKN